MAIVKFQIKKDGTVSTDITGVVGKSCADISKIFTDALGTITEVEEKEEFYDQVDDIEASLYEGGEE